MDTVKVSKFYFNLKKKSVQFFLKIGSIIFESYKFKWQQIRSVIMKLITFFLY